MAGLSSHQLRAAALESERSQQENEARSQSIEAQIAALRAQQEAADNDAKRYCMEKETRQQAAREQSFHEISVKAQEALRIGLADEVYTRVAHSLADLEAWQSLEDISQGQTDIHKLDKLKIILWEAIAGDDQDFLVDAARKIVTRREEQISNADVAAIQSSKICLQSHLLPAENMSYADVSEIEDSTMTDRAFAHEAGSTISHKPMTELEEEYTSTITAPYNNGKYESVSPIFSPCSPRSDLSPDFDRTASRTVSETPVTPKKRASTDTSLLSNTNSNASPRATKKSKTPRVSSSGSDSEQRISAFIEKTKSDASARNPIDFNCAECGNAVQKDALITSCLHLYDKECLKNIRAGSIGKQAQKIKCHRPGCGEEIGTAYVLARNALRNLRKTFEINTLGNDCNADDLMEEDDDA